MKGGESTGKSKLPRYYKRKRHPYSKDASLRKVRSEEK